MNNGRPYSYRPRYYGSGTSRYATTNAIQRFQMRPPLWLGAGVAVGFMFYAIRQDTGEPKCLAYPNTFQFGGKCRDCSDWECPIGQYRVPCTAGTDSYCKPCTNKPSSTTFTYLTPGNDNDCVYKACGSGSGSGSGTNLKVIDSPLIQLSCLQHPHMPKPLSGRLCVPGPEALRS